MAFELPWLLAPLMLRALILSMSRGNYSLTMKLYGVAHELAWLLKPLMLCELILSVSSVTYSLMTIVFSEKWQFFYPFTAIARRLLRSSRNKNFFNTLPTRLRRQLRSCENKYFFQHNIPTRLRRI